jgi:glycosyltransferase involved in cell wall biosynthesis
MKIVIYISSMSPAGGIERVISQHIEFLSKENEIILITDDSKESFYKLPKNVKHLYLDIDTELSLKVSKFKRIQKISLSFIKNVILLRKELKVIKPDCVYTAHPLNLIKVIFSIRNNKKIFVTEHASIFAYNSIYKRLALRYYKKIKLLTVPTTLDSETYKNLGVQNEYLPNPLPFYPDESAELKNKLAINIGRFTDDKQQTLLIDLWAKSKAIENGWKLKIIGTGENEEIIKRKIAEYKLEDNIIIIKPTKHIVEEYLTASLFLFTSRAEGFGLVLAEAMACGVPCISFNCPSGPRDIIDDNINGFLVKVGDSETYIENINILTSDFELRKKFGFEAKRSIKKFSSELISERINELVQLNFNKS